MYPVLKGVFASDEGISKEPHHVEAFTIRYGLAVFAHPHLAVDVLVHVLRDAFRYKHLHPIKSMQAIQDHNPLDYLTSLHDIIKYMLRIVRNTCI